MFFWRRRHPVRDEELSAYLDEQLGQAVRARLEAHLEACAACREAVAELRAVRRALGELPRSSAPRSFALREADVRPTAAPQPMGALSRAPALLGGVATAAVLVFGVLVGLDVATEPSAAGPGAGAGMAAFDVSEGAGEEMLPREPAAPTLALEAGAPPLAQATAPATGEEGYLDERAERILPAAPSPESEEAARASAEEGDGRSRLRVAEAATAAVALVAGGSLALVWWRRRGARRP